MKGEDVDRASACRVLSSPLDRFSVWVRHFSSPCKIALAQKTMMNV